MVLRTCASAGAATKSAKPVRRKITFASFMSQFPWRLGLSGRQWRFVLVPDHLCGQQFEELGADRRAARIVPAILHLIRVVLKVVELTNAGIVRERQPPSLRRQR